MGCRLFLNEHADEIAPIAPCANDYQQVAFVLTSDANYIIMLGADRAAVHAQLGERAVMLRHLELKLYSAGLKAVSLQAAMLAGFTLLAFLFMTFIRASTVNEDRWFVLQISLISTFGLALLAVLISTFSLLHGPGLALRGNVAGSTRSRKNASSTSSRACRR